MDFASVVKNGKSSLPVLIPLVKSESEEGSVLNVDICHIKEESTSALISDVKIEDTPIGISFPLLKCEAVGESLDIVPVKEEFNSEKTTGSEVSSERPLDKKANGNHVCKQCGTKFTNNANLERHLKTHVGVRSFGCAQCGKHFAEKYNLKVHMRTHTGERPYTCTECGKQMRYRQDFADHKKQHLGVKPFECTECGQRFLRQRELVRHKTRHSGEKKYKCPICNKAFARLDQLKLVHMRRHDLTPSPTQYVCPICHKGFKVKAQLEKHQILHSGEKNHHCPMCDKTFALDAYLKLHLKTHKKQDDYIQCPKCPRRFVSQETLQVHDEKFHIRMEKKPRTSMKKKKKRSTLNQIPDPTLLEPEIETLQT